MGRDEGRKLKGRSDIIIFKLKIKLKKENHSYICYQFK